MDLESTNGTFVNGKRITGPTWIETGAEVRFGIVRFAVLGGSDGAMGIGGWRRRIEAIAGIILALFIGGFLFARSVIFPHTRSGSLSSYTSRTTVAGNTSKSRGTFREVAEDKGTASVPAWLARLNHFRAMAALSPVTENAALSMGDFSHARYLVANFGERIRAGESLGPLMHTEEPGRKWYSVAGHQAASASDVIEGYVGNGTGFTGRETVDGWLSLPFHRLPLLSPLLRSAGYGQYCEAGVCAAALNSETGADPIHSVARVLPRPIQFPPNGSIISLRAGENEWPDPLTACPGYAPPTGLAVTLQLGTWMAPHLTDFTLERGGRAIDACGFDATSYRNPDSQTQQAGREVLKTYGAVVLIPRKPLQSGSHYTVSLAVDGTSYRWSFSVR
jgi:uncharacterized protein YkwD